MNEVEQSAETLISNFRNSVEMLAERMQTISGTGKHIAMDATVQVHEYTLCSNTSLDQYFSFEFSVALS